MPVNQPWPALEEVMENFAELMQRLLEIQSGERQRSLAARGRSNTLNQ
jgi:hypothetical protein